MTLANEKWKICDVVDDVFLGLDRLQKYNSTTVNIWVVNSIVFEIDLELMNEKE